jgi:hypothetical protein
MGEPNGTRPLGKHRQRSEYDIKIELKLTGSEIVDTTIWLSIEICSRLFGTW